MLIYVPIMFAVVAYKKLRTSDIQPEMEEFSKCKFAFMALLDVMHVSIVTISGGIIPAPLTVLLLQSAVPATMFASRFFLGHKYKWTHYIASFFVLVGLSIHMVPMIDSVVAHSSNSSHPLSPSPSSINASSTSSSSPANNPTTETDVLFNCLIYVLCCIPGALSAIYKEYALQTQPMDMYYLNLWVTFFQFIISIPFAPIGFHYQQWSIDNNDHNWGDFQHMFENIGMGTDCWLKGINPNADYVNGDAIIGAEYAHCEVSSCAFFFQVFSKSVANVNVLNLFFCWKFIVFVL